MLANKLKKLREAYQKARPEPKVEDPIELAHFLKEVRILLSELEKFCRDVGGDETAIRNRFARVTTAGAIKPTRFRAVERKETMIQTVRRKQ